MLITAVVQYRGNTLVVGLPLDRLDLELKLHSVGIESMSDQISVVDDEEISDVSVKLFSDTQIGQRLSLLFGEEHTLFQVNKTLQYVANADEEIRDELDKNIVHDPYNSPEQLAADIDRMTEALGRYTETFYFPLTGNLQDTESFWSETSNSYLKSFKWEIRELLGHEQDMDGESMRDFFYDDDNAQRKMVSCRWNVTERNHTLYGKVEVRLKEPFTAEEKEAVRNWITGQNADGLGEGFEQRPIETEDGDLYVSMWNSTDDYFVYDEEEMKEYLDQQQCGMTLQ